MTRSLGSLADFTVIRLADGRVGMKGHWTRRGKAIVQFADGSGAEFDKTEPVEVVRFPAQLARDHLQTLRAEEIADQIVTEAFTAHGHTAKALAAAAITVATTRQITGADPVPAADQYL